MMLTLSVELYSEAGVITDIKDVELFSSPCPVGCGVNLTGTFQFQIL